MAADRAARARTPDEAFRPEGSGCPVTRRDVRFPFKGDVACCWISIDVGLRAASHLVERWPALQADRSLRARRRGETFRPRAPAGARIGFAGMRELHQLNALALLAANALAFGWGALYLLRKRPPGRLYAHVLALAQSLVIAQVALGLLLLSDGRRVADDLHYLYGALALGAVLSPWLYAPPVPARRLAWFVGATLLTTALAVRAYTTAT